MKDIFELSVRLPLEVAHFLASFPEGHPNRKIHGHSYWVSAWIKGPVDPETEILMDFEKLKKHLQEILSELDHRLLNEIPEIGAPSTENISRYVWKKLSALKTPFLDRIEIERPTLGMKVIYRGPQE